MWVGATDKANEGSFVWTDGSPFSFTSWEGENPDNAGDDQHCVTTNYLEPGLWDDLWCTNEDNPTAFVCKKADDLPKDEPDEDIAAGASPESRTCPSGIPV